MSDQIKYLLDESRMPKAWYNIAADLPVPLPPPLHPGTLQPLGPSDLAPIFPNAIIAQEMSTERYIDIPEPVREVLCQWRPSPCSAPAASRSCSARRPRSTTSTKASPGRQPQAQLRRAPGLVQRPGRRQAPVHRNRCRPVGLVAGLRGRAVRAGRDGLPGACLLRPEALPPRPDGNLGRPLHPSPSPETEYGRAVLAQHPDHIGSLGIAISEAVEVAAKNDDTKYALGSVLNHVLLHQTIVGEEAILQMEMAGDDPDVVISCVGGGSNFAGIAFPFIGLQLRGGPNAKKRRIVAVEPSACPSLSRGKYAYDFGDTAHLTPLVKMHTLGSDFTPPGLHAGGLRYHGMAPLVSHVKELGLIEAKGVHQTACFEAGVMFARSEGIVPAPESTHAIRGAIDEALRCKAEGKSETILFCLSGHGHFDMTSYTNYLSAS
jgi:tryptophan synthase beta chain